MCTWTPHPDIARGFLSIVALADLGHIYATYLGMESGGKGVFWGWEKWNDLAWGNVGASAFLCVNRVGTVLGLFGTVGGGREKGKVRGKNA